ncbi:hypothetical protein [Streptomyces parvulus]
MRTVRFLMCSDAATRARNGSDGGRPTREGPG